MRRLGLEILGMGCAARCARAAGVAVMCALAASLSVGERASASEPCPSWDVEYWSVPPYCFSTVRWIYYFDDMNDAGVAVGSRACVSSSDAIRWTGEGPVEVLEFPSGYGDSFSTAVNAAGTICGYVAALSEDPPIRRGFVLPDGGEMVFIDPPAGSAEVFALAINDSGLVVGYYGSGTGDPPYAAFTWIDGVFTSLREVHGPWVFPLDVSDSGEIVGYHLPGYPGDLTRHPMSIVGSELQSLTMPSSAVEGQVRGVNSSGVKVGSVRRPLGGPDGPNRSLAAIWTGDGVEYVEPVGACESTSFRSINERGWILGSRGACNGGVQTQRSVFVDGAWLDPEAVVAGAPDEIIDIVAMSPAGSIVLRGRIVEPKDVDAWNGVATLAERTAGDVDCDGRAAFSDVLAVLAAWGDCGAGGCPADLNGDLTVGVLDLLIVIDHWGP